MTATDHSALRWPAEWEPQSSVWFTWPHAANTFGNHLCDIQALYIQTLLAIAETQPVCLNTPPQLIPSLAKQIDHPRITLHSNDSNDIWCRDHGATFTLKKDKLHAVSWKFNAWGGKFPPYDLDDQIAGKMATATDSSIYQSPLYLEGGAIEGNGAGTLITTEAVALNANRNPDWTKEQVEAELCKALGVTNIFWLPSGIEGDDTDGHIDDLTRFIAEDTIVTATCQNTSSPDHHTLARNREMLQDLRTTSGSKIQIFDLPMPDPVPPPRGWRLSHLPASYANFLILNELVLVPIFQQKQNDEKIISLFNEFFPTRTVLPIDCSLLIHEGGAIHCISQQQAAVPSEKNQ